MLGVDGEDVELDLLKNGFKMELVRHYLEKKLYLKGWLKVLLVCEYKNWHTNWDFINNKVVETGIYILTGWVTHSNKTKTHAVALRVTPTLRYIIDSADQEKVKAYKYMLSAAYLVRLFRGGLRTVYRLQPAKAAIIQKKVLINV